MARPWQKVHPRLSEMLAASQAGDTIDVFINVFESDLTPASTAKTVGAVWEGGPGQEPTLRYDESLLAKEWMSNGWQQEALQELGIAISQYIPEGDAFRARITPEQLPALVALDFVQFVEPDLPTETNHDESMPLIGADQHRATYNRRCLPAHERRDHRFGRAGLA